MYELGTKVDYIRQDTEKQELVKSEGIIKGIFLSPENRVLVNIKDGDSSYNVDYNAVNYTEEFENVYNDVLIKVKKVSKEGNDKVQELVSEYNDLVDEMYNTILGEPVEVE